MTELVTVEQAEAVFLTLVWVGPLLGALIGLIVGYVRRCLTAGLWQGVAVGLLGPIIYAAWRFYEHTVSYDPATGEAGLHKVSVHVLNALIFITAGVALGVVYRRWVFPETGDEPEADDAAPDEPEADDAAPDEPEAADGAERDAQ
ncbi:MAG: hypothetical protein ACOX9R_12410 [Armatimonadota bacterium]|jgi:hypothetical protein